MFSFIFKILFFIYTAVSEDRNANEDFLVWGGLRVESGEPISNMSPPMISSYNKMQEKHFKIL